MSDTEATWERLRLLMPRHDCGRRMEPGVLGERHMLVCAPCSYVAQADPEWVDRVVAEAEGVGDDE